MSTEPCKKEQSEDELTGQAEVRVSRTVRKPRDIKTDASGHRTVVRADSGKMVGRFG